MLMDWRRLTGDLGVWDWVFLLVSALLIGHIWDLNIFGLTDALIRSAILAIIYVAIARTARRPFEVLAWALLASLFAIVAGPALF